MAKDDLIVEIGADIADLEKGLARAKKKLGEFDETTQKTSKGFSMSMGKMKGGVTALAAAVAAAGVAIVAFSNHAKENILIVDRWAKRLGVATEDFSALVKIGKRVGAEVDDVGDAIKDLNERIADAARGNKTYEGSLNMIGLASRDLINLPVEEQFIKVADAIGKMNNVGDQNFATADLMADAGFRLLEMFRLGEDAIRDNMKALKDSNNVITGESVEAAKKLQTSQNELGEAWENSGKILIDVFEPALSSANTTLALFLNTVNANIRAIDDFLEKAPKALEQIRKDANETTAKVRQNNSATSSSGLMLPDNLGGGLPAFAPLSPMLDIMPEEQDAQAEVSKYFNDLLSAAQEKAAGFAERFTEVWNEARAEAEQTGAGDINSLFEEELARKEEHEMSLVDIKRRSQEEMTRIQKANADIQANIEKAKNKQMMADTKSTLSFISGAMNSENRKMFEMGKAASIANATISAYEGVGRALGAFPPPFNFAAAAAVAAAGVANVANIASTSMGGGGGGVSGGVGGAGAGSPPAPEVINQSNFDISFQGEGGVAQDDVRSLIGKINEEIANGAQIGTINVR